MIEIYDCLSGPGPDKDDQHETNTASLAKSHELCQPIEAIRTSCNRRADKFITQLSKWFNVRCPETMRIIGAQVGLRRLLGPGYVSCGDQSVKFGKKKNSLIKSLDFFGISRL